MDLGGLCITSFPKTKKNVTFAYSFFLIVMTEKFQNTYRVSTARAAWHDYDGGMYFVTICTQNREYFFGEIAEKNGEKQMFLSEMGRVAEYEIKKTAEIRKYMNVSIPVFAIMPDHVHLIVCIDGNERTDCRAATLGGSNPNINILNSDVENNSVDDEDVRDDENARADGKNNRADGKNTRAAKRGGSTRFGPQRNNLASIIRGIKSAITQYARINNIDFAWQTRFYERIIRDQNEINHIAEYIENNAANWHLDEFFIQ